MDAYETTGTLPGTWIWSHSGDSVTYTNWRTGEPNKAWQQFGQLGRSYGWKWNDIPYNMHFTYICEKNHC